MTEAPRYGAETREKWIDSRQRQGVGCMSMERRRRTFLAGALAAGLGPRAL
jgi:hypothetical protein